MNFHVPRREAISPSRSSSPRPERMSRITTWCDVIAIRRPSGSIAASVELPHAIGARVSGVGLGWGLGLDCAVGEGCGGVRLDCTQDARFVEPPRSYVEMIMKANRPALGAQLGRADGPEAAAHWTSVMSKVRSSPGGLALDCERSVYFQVPG